MALGLGVGLIGRLLPRNAYSWTVAPAVYGRHDHQENGFPQLNKGLLVRQQAVSPGRAAPLRSRPSAIRDRGSVASNPSTSPASCSTSYKLVLLVVESAFTLRLP